MAETTIQQKFRKAIEGLPLSAPWSLLKRKIAFNAAKYSYPIQHGTMRNIVCIHEPFIKAALLYDSVPELNGSRGFRMVRKKRSNNETFTFLEVRQADDTSFVVGVHKRQDGEYDFRASIYETNSTKGTWFTSVLPFKDMDSFGLTCCMLALWPDILQIDNEAGNGYLRGACSDLASGIAAVPPSNWTSESDIPDAVKESAYFLDAIMHIMPSKMVIHCGVDNSDTPLELNLDWFDSANMLSGGLLVEHIPDDWNPIVVRANGKAAKLGGKAMTIAEAKDQFAVWSADRNWTPAEQQLIPKMPDDMPVMPEVLRIANRIVNTMNDLIPACNFIWRGETGFGKSTGIKQLACILNTPLLTMTCHPGMGATRS